ncbi:MAG: SixA phosphatase family protein [Ilumatobacteraceae bacterium]
MAVLLVRHAKAGDRSRWSGDDQERPLSAPGREQAEALVAAIGHTPTLLVSSPYRRCIETLEPLGHAHGLLVGTDERLAEDGDLEPALELLAAIPDGAVLCSHGDMIPMVIDALIRRGLELTNAVPAVKKGSWFALERDGVSWTRATWFPAPRQDAE